MTERLTHEEYVAMQRRRVTALAILAMFLVVISLLTRPARVHANAAEEKPASRSGDRLRRMARRPGDRRRTT